MITLRLICTSLLLCVACLCISAENPRQEHKALLAIAPALQHLDFVWSSAEGDLNGDGIPDLALLATGQKGEGPREERLIVLFGNADGSYRVVSVSADFCHPGKFYNLAIEKNALFVQAVHYADSARFSGFTLQFRYNAKIKDFEHIGELQNDERYSNDSYYRVSLNYLTGAAIHSRRSGKKYKEVRGRLTNSPGILPLNGFICSGYGMTSSSVYIDDNFKARKKDGASP